MVPDKMAPFSTQPELSQIPPRAKVELKVTKQDERRIRGKLPPELDVISEDIYSFPGECSCGPGPCGTPACSDQACEEAACVV